MGFVHIYCGDGKGKTTSSIGLCIRYIGAGGNVLLYQFMKNQKSSELEILRMLNNVTVMNGFEMTKFSFQLTDFERNQIRDIYANEFNRIRKEVYSGNFGMLIMDEIMSCISCGFLSEESVVDFIINRPTNIEIVMTGRDPSEKIIACADYVSEIKKIKHPYDKGISSRKGIEY